MSREMVRIVNIIKIILLIFILVGTTYINLTWFDKKGLNPFDDFFTFFGLIIPYAILLVFLVLNIVRGYKEVNNNKFFHITSFLSLGTIIYIIYRSIDDLRMVLLSKDGIGSNYYYFDSWIPSIKIMVYGMIIINIILIIKEYYRRKNIYN